MKKYPVLLLAFLPFCAVAAQQGPRLIGQYGDWLAYIDQSSGQDICYMASMPKKEEGNYKTRGDVFALVAHRPKEKSFDVFNLIAGYNFQKNAPVTVEVDRQKFSDFYTDKDAAWTLYDRDDLALIQAMKKGQKMVVNGVSSRGTKTKDTYSLKGFTKAYEAISKKCGKKK